MLAVKAVVIIVTCLFALALSASLRERDFEVAGAYLVGLLGALMTDIAAFT